MKGFRRRISDTASGPATYIAPQSRVTGSIGGQGAYVVCGRVDGDCDIDGLLTLAEGGHWLGMLRATDVIVAGTVDGDVVASNRVEIASTARISGTLSGRTIAVEEGAIIQGKLTIANGGEATKYEEKRGSVSQKLAAG